MALVRVTQTLPYRGATFQAGKIYDVEDQPLNFVNYWFSTQGYGEILADESALNPGESVQPDPRKDKKSVKPESNLVDPVNTGATTKDEDEAKKATGKGTSTAKEAKESGGTASAAREATQEQEEGGGGGKPKLDPKAVQEVTGGKADDKKK